MTAPGVRRASVLAAAYLVLGALTLSPLLWAAVPPLVDYPGHLARMWILLHARDIPTLGQNYIVDWRLLPNLAMDLLVPPLTRLLPLEIVGRLFIAATMINLVIGTMTLHRALFGRIGLWPLCSLLFVYNAVLFWGFLNFLFTLGLSLLAFSGWVAADGWRMPARIIVFAVLASLIFVFHLFAFGVYGLLVASYELGKWPAQRGGWARKSLMTLLPLTQFVPAAGLWLASLSNAEPGRTAFGDWSFKLYAALTPWDFGVWPGQIDGVMLLATILFLLYAGFTGALRLSPRMRVPVLTMIIAAVLMPNWLYGSWGADLRLPVAMSFVVVAATQLDASRRRLAACAAVVALALLGARIWAVSEDWRGADRQFAEFRAAARAIPEGARVLMVQDNPGGAHPPAIEPTVAPHYEMPAYWHMLDLMVIDRSAFTPYLPVGVTAVHPSPRNADIFQSWAVPLTPLEFEQSLSPEWRPSASEWPDRFGRLPYWRNWAPQFDFVLWVDFSHALPPPALDARLQRWSEGSFFRFYRLDRS